MDDFVYVLKKYPFYDASAIIMISENYEKVKEHFNKIVDKTDSGYGYVIRKYRLDEVYSLVNDGEPIDWVTIDYDWRFKDVMRG